MALVLGGQIFCGPDRRRVSSRSRVVLVRIFEQNGLPRDLEHLANALRRHAEPVRYFPPALVHGRSRGASAAKCVESRRWFRSGASREPRPHPLMRGSLCFPYAADEAVRCSLPLKQVRVRPGPRKPHFVVCHFCRSATNPVRRGTPSNLSTLPSMGAADSTLATVRQVAISR